MITNILIKAAEILAFFALFCLLVFISNFINEKTKAEKSAKFGDIIKAAVQASVTYVNQTLVEKLKKSGEFSVEKQKEALDTALDRCKLLIDKETSDFILMNYGDTAAYLKTLIEAEVKKQKSTSVSTCNSFPEVSIVPFNYQSE